MAGTIAPHAAAPAGHPSPRLTPNALRVLERRYLARDERGRVSETPEQMFHRVARNVALPDAVLPCGGKRDPAATEADFYRMMATLEFLPNSPTLMNAGRDLQQLCACFVLPVEDSMEGIFESLKRAALIHQTGGGTGFSFSRLRPRNSRVATTSGVASGPVSFMKVFNAATEAIKQGGARRGANMGILRVDHPDILEFIDCKRDGSEVTNFNISVAVTDSFMRAIEAPEPSDRYDLIDPRDGSRAGQLGARDVFDRIVQSAWMCGDPGLVFIDRINRSNPTHHVASIEATNPCGEQPLSNNEACTLGSINLGLMLDEGRAAIDYGRLGRVVRDAVHFLDNVIEASRYPVAEIERVTKANRRIGLGVMGWADLLISLDIPYDSDEALRLAERVMAFIQGEATRASADLARERGAFQNFEGSLRDVAGGPPLRNATTTTVAPTGTLSIIAGASSGIEPLFGIVYARRNVLDLAPDEELQEVHPQFLARARRLGILTDDLLQEVAAKGSLRALTGHDVPAAMKRVFVTAHDLDPEWHVRMQAAFQKHCDNAVSKTVNLAESATPQDVRRAYLSAWELGCKGITVYRDRSRGRQVLAKGEREAATLSRFMRKGEIRSLDSLARALLRHHRPPPPVGSRATAGDCPDCGSAQWAEARCPSCRYCGYTTCV